MRQSPTESLNDAFMTLTPFAIFFFIFGTVAFAVAIAYIIRLWLTQTATFQIQKDVADIRNHLLGYQVEDITPTMPPTVDNGYVEPLQPKKELEFKRPRKLFLWVSLSIPILIICLFIIIISLNT